jgi:hypothetical protein
MSTREELIEDARQERSDHRSDTRHTHPYYCACATCLPDDVDDSEAWAALDDDRRSDESRGA